eukprot:scaffold20060_cov73-Skeletonema_marinoi.AAC.1
MASAAHLKLHQHAMCLMLGSDKLFEYTAATRDAESIGIAYATTPLHYWRSPDTASSNIVA